MTKDNKDRIMEAIASITSIPTEVFVELSHLLYEDKTCSNCKFLNKFDRCTAGVTPTSRAVDGEVEDFSKTFSCNKWEQKRGER